MHKIISAIRWVGNNFFVVTLGILIFIYLWGFQIAPFVFVFSDTAFVFGIILLAIYGAIVMFLKFTKNQTCSRIFLTFVTIFFFCLIVPYVYYFKPSLTSSAKCNGTTYYLTIHPNSPITVDWYHYRLTKWDGLFKYDSTLFGLAASYSYEMTCDEKENQVRIFDSLNSLYYTDGTESRYYDSGYHQVSINDKTYELASYDVDGIRRYIVVECADETADSCQLNPVDHSSPSVQDEMGSVIADVNTNELYILFDGKVYFAYGDESRKFNNLASIKAENRIQYSIASYQRNNSYFYVLYMCDFAEYADCDYIRFSYSTPDQENANLVIDKAADTLSVYIADKLIFTKGLSDSSCDDGCLDSRCHIEGCLIPKP